MLHRHIGTLGDNIWGDAFLQKISRHFFLSFLFDFFDFFSFPRPNVHNLSLLTKLVSVFRVLFLQFFVPQVYDPLKKKQEIVLVFIAPPALREKFYQSSQVFKRQAGRILAAVPKTLILANFLGYALV